MNRQTFKTKVALKTALTELLKSKSIHQIYVTDLCEIADVNRSTFYRYYDDVYAALDEIEQDYISAVSFDGLLENSDDLDALDSYTHMLQITKDKWSVFCCLWENGTLAAKSHRKTMRLISVFCKNNYPPLCTDTPVIRHISESIVTLATGQIMLWEKTGFKLSCRQMAGFLAALQHETAIRLCSMYLP